MAYIKERLYLYYASITPKEVNIILFLGNEVSRQKAMKWIRKLKLLCFLAHIIIGLLGGSSYNINFY